MSKSPLPKLDDRHLGLLERAITGAGLLLSESEALCILAELRELRAHVCDDRFHEGYDKGRKSHS